MNTDAEFWTAFFRKHPDVCLAYEKADDGVSVFLYDQPTAQRVGPRLDLFATMREAGQVTSQGRMTALQTFPLSRF